MKTLLVSCLITFCAFAASAQYAIDWFTIDGGGGASSGGNYSINGTIGQPDAGAMNGGPYALVGGFWSGVDTVGVATRPQLSIRFGTGNTVVLSWPNPSTGYVLQQTANMNGPVGDWTDMTLTPIVNGPSKEVTLQAAGPFFLFRLSHP